VTASWGWQEATFRLQLFAGAGLRPVAVITQVVPAEGAGSINHAERYTEAVWQQLLPAEPLPPIVIGHMPAGVWGGEGELSDLGWMPVGFRVAGRSRYALQSKISATWRSLQGLADFATLRSYLSTATKHGQDLLDILTAVFTTGPWLPPDPAR